MLLLGAATLVAAWSFGAAPAEAQIIQFPQRPQRIKPAEVQRPQGEKAPMLLQATEVQYDYSNKRVSAVGNVQIYHQGSTLESDRVTYDENTKRLRAEGNVRMTEPDGRITYADVMDLSDDFRDGFVDSLRLDTADQTRMAAARADRSAGTFTVFHSGVYTACEPCKDDPKKPPTWQVKAARMIHDGTEKMIYFEDARIEIFGHPIAYMPYFSAPDPTVKRKSGYLFPIMSQSSIYGFGVEVPYYWALAPDYDVTFTPRVMSRQGVLLRGEWRQRLIDGAYSIRASGIYQLDKDAFLRDGGQPPTPGFRDFRGSIETSGQFALTDRWSWGWDGILPTDKTFFQDYHLSTYQRGANVLMSGLTEGVSQLYLTGRGDRSYFDIRTIYYYGFSEADNQSQIPVIHPVLDYSYIFNNPVYGGELGYRFNFTSLSRQTAAFDPVTTTAFNSGTCGLSADPTRKLPASCLLRGFPGTYTRASGDITWKRSITDPFGQIFTPFVSLRADAGMASIDNQPGVSNYLHTGDTSQFRVMPTVGLEYRYPFINVQSWGTQTIEPIAQLIARPNETGIGKLPNEDSQSLLFDDSNLFRVDKFSGWDRVEGGGRANVGMQYTAQFNRGGFVNALFGQSYQLFGTNSFAVADTANTGIGSGLDSDRSDYVARVMYQPDRILSFTTRFRFDKSTFDVQRFEAEAKANFDRWSVSVLYGDYAAQPALGFLDRRQGILTNGSVKITQNWQATAAVRYDLDANKLSGTQFGVGYIDDCLILALNYMRNYNFSGVATRDDRIMLQVTLRTLGGTAVGQTVSSGPAGL